MAPDVTDDQLSDLDFGALEDDVHQCSLGSGDVAEPSEFPLPCDCEETVMAPDVAGN
jgi:hypothetical protein